MTTAFRRCSAAWAKMLSWDRQKAPAPEGPAPAVQARSAAAVRLHQKLARDFSEPRNAEQRHVAVDFVFQEFYRVAHAGVAAHCGGKEKRPPDEYELRSKRE